MASEKARYSFRLVVASLEAVEEDARFRISTWDNADGLASSVARVGLLVPPLAVAGGGRFRLISGFRRLAACRALGWPELPLRVPEGHPTPAECARLAIAENAWSRALNLIELSRAVNLLAQFSPAGRVDPEEAAAAGLPGGEAFLVRIAPLCRLPQAAQEAVLEEAVSLWTAAELARMPAEAAEALAGLFRRLKAGLNVQREILTHTREIALREGVPVRELLAAPEFTALLDEAGGDPNKTTRRVRGFLRRRRYPHLSAAEERFRTLLRELPLASGLRVQPPRDFEGTRFALQLEFETAEEARLLRGRLDRLLEHPAFGALLEGKRRGYETEPQGRS